MQDGMITVALSFLDAEATIEAAVRSVLRQSYTNWQLLLIDDGSRDRTPELVARFADPRIRVLRDGERRGLAARLNQAIDLAEGEFFARMDADDLCFPDRFARQVSFLRENPSVDLVGTRALIFTDYQTTLGFQRYRGTHGDICERPWLAFELPHPSWMGRVPWFRNHRYRERMRRAQDQDLLLRSFRSSTFANRRSP